MELKTTEESDLRDAERNLKSLTQRTGIETTTEKENDTMSEQVYILIQLFVMPSRPRAPR